MKYHFLLPYLFSAQLSWNCEEFFQILQTTHRFARVCLKMRFESATVTFPLSLYISLFVSLPLFDQWLGHVAPSGMYNFLILWCMRAFISGSQHCSPLPSCFACFNFLMFSVQLKTPSSFAFISAVHGVRHVVTHGLQRSSQTAIFRASFSPFSARRLRR